MINKVFIKIPIRATIIFCYFFPHILRFSIYLTGGYFELWNFLPITYCINMIEENASSFSTDSLNNFTAYPPIGRTASIGSASSLINNSLSIIPLDNFRLRPLEGRTLSIRSTQTTREIYVTLVPIENSRVTLIRETNCSIRSGLPLTETSPSVISGNIITTPPVGERILPIGINDSIVNITEIEENRLSTIIPPVEVSPSATTSSESLYVKIDDSDSERVKKTSTIIWWRPTIFPGCSNTVGARWGGTFIGVVARCLIFNSSYGIIYSQGNTCIAYEMFNNLFGFGS